MDPLAGSNAILKEGQILFHEGDTSDGMYVVRRGEILIYLEKGGQEIKLAKVTSGAMIGEMALFDKKPRSAAAKAIQETELTKISNEDFKKIMKQIPKWFVALMTSLSTRLRETNERLQAIEQKRTGGNVKPLDNVTKVIGVLALVWHKEGTKEAKTWLLERAPAEEQVAKILDVETSTVNGITKALVDSKLVGCKPNSYKKDVLFIANRAVIEKFLEFLQDFTKANPDTKAFPEPAMELLEVLRGMIKESAYETVTIPLEDATTEGERQSLDTDGWKDLLPLFKELGEGLRLVKVSNGIGFRVTKKHFPKLLDQLTVLQSLEKSGVS